MFSPIIDDDGRECSIFDSTLTGTKKLQGRSPKSSLPVFGSIQRLPMSIVFVPHNVCDHA